MLCAPFIPRSPQAGTLTGSQVCSSVGASMETWLPANNWLLAPKSLEQMGSNRAPLSLLPPERRVGLQLTNKQQHRQVVSCRIAGTHTSDQHRPRAEGVGGRGGGEKVAWAPGGARGGQAAADTTACSPAAQTACAGAQPTAAR